MLKGLAEQHHIRGAEAIVLIARKRSITVYVGPAECRLDIERHDVARGHESTRQEETEADAAIQIFRDRRARRFIDVLGTFIRSVLVTGQIRFRRGV